MRTRVVRSRAGKRSYLEVKLGRREELDVRRLRMLEGVRCRSFLAPVWELPQPGDVGAVIRYDVTGLTPLHGFVRKDVLSHQKYERMLASVAEVVGACRALGLDVSAVLFDDSRVFTSFDGMLRFAYVPLMRGVRASATTPLGLVGTLSDTRRLRFYLQEDELIARDVAWFHDESESFDVDRYAQLLSREFGVVPKTLLNPRFSHMGHPSPLVYQGVNRGQEPGRDHRGGEGVLKAGEAGNAPIPSTPLTARRPLHSTDVGHVMGGCSELEGLDVSSAGVRMGDGLAPEAESAEDHETERYELVRLNTGERYLLAADETLTLGRSDACSVQILDNPDLSRRQATVVCEPEGCLICDLGSANGTVVRGHHLGESESAQVALGETFQLAGEPFAIVLA